MPVEVTSRWVQYFACIKFRHPLPPPPPSPNKRQPVAWLRRDVGGGVLFLTHSPAHRPPRPGANALPRARSSLRGRCDRLVLSVERTLLALRQLFSAYPRVGAQLVWSGLDNGGNGVVSPSRGCQRCAGWSESWPLVCVVDETTRPTFFAGSGVRREAKWRPSPTVVPRTGLRLPKSVLF